MSSSRDEVLGRVRRALGAPGAQPVDVPRAYRTSSPLDREAVLRRFAERVEDYRATVARVPAAEAADGVAVSLAGARSVVVPAGFEPSWVPDGVQVHVDRVDAPLSALELDGIDAVLTASAVAIAETGTVVLDGGSGQGRRALSLVPDRHVVVVRADHVVATVPEAVRRLDAPRPQTWISGPSATSDIELDRVEGVHGPRTLRVVLLEA